MKFMIEFCSHGKPIGECGTSCQEVDHFRHFNPKTNRIGRTVIPLQLLKGQAISVHRKKPKVTLLPRVAAIHMGDNSPVDTDPETILYFV